MPLDLARNAMDAAGSGPDPGLAGRRLDLGGNLAQEWVAPALVEWLRQRDQQVFFLIGQAVRHMR